VREAERLVDSLKYSPQRRVLWLRVTALEVVLRSDLSCTWEEVLTGWVTGYGWQREESRVIYLGWLCGSSDRVLASKIQGPEFKPTTTKARKKERERKKGGTL
jgi:hypothetical protein